MDSMARHILLRLFICCALVAVILAGVVSPAGALGILVADAGSHGPSVPPGSIRVVGIDPTSGIASQRSAGDLLRLPRGIAVKFDSGILIADENAFSEAGAIIQIDPLSGQQTALSVGGAFGRPTDLAIEANGDIVAVSRLGNAVYGVNPITGSQETISVGGFLTNPRALARYGVKIPRSISSCQKSTYRRCRKRSL
jgi:hypothetical protein